MESRREFQRDSEWVEDADEILSEPDVVLIDIPDDAPSAKVRLISLRDEIIKINGPVTGEYYEFRGAGQVIEVYAEDANLMLARNSGRSCCGGETSYYFELAK